MTNKFYKKIIISIITLVVLFSATRGLATATTTKDYVPLEKNAFIGFNTSNTGNQLVDFLVNVFNFGIAAAVTLALIMIIYGGIMYMTADSWMGKDDGKTAIQNALAGLALALAAYSILYLVNPCLVVFTNKDGCTNTFLYPSTTK